MTTLEAGYAQALLRAAQMRGCVERLAEELPAVETLIAEHAVYFFNPRVPARKKAGLLNDVLGGQADGLLLSFLALLAQRRHLKRLPGIRRSFDKLAEAELGVITVHLRIPYEPSKELLDRLNAYLAGRGLFPSDSKNAVRFEIELDKSLIGGFVAECGGKMLDASVKTRLTRLRRRMSAEPTS